MTLHHTLEQVKKNWKAGLTVSLVSLPLSISLAIAANATPVMGVITAIWAGIIASLFGGSHFNIVGPTGALSGLLAMYAILYGVGALPALAIMTGILILICYIFRVDRYITFIPSSVIHGFTLGVAFIIGLNQLNFSTGLTGLPAHQHFIENVWESIKHLGNIDPITFILFLVTFALLFIFLKKVPKIPGPIIVAFLGIGIGYLSSIEVLPFTLQTLYTKYGDLSPSLFSIPQFGNLFANFELWKAALAISVIAILETLISAKIADRMTKTKFHQRKEVLGLGLANLASGLFGGIPATAALARTALNVKSGATHKTSGIINALAVIVIALLLLSWFKYLPMAIVASILVYVAVRMVESEHFKHIYKHDKIAFYLSLVVAFITIVEDPIVGILVGAVISLLIFVNNISKAQAEITVNKNKKVIERVTAKTLREGKKLEGDIIVYRFAGQMTYVNAPSHIELVEKIHDAQTVILSFRNLFFVDVDGMDALSEIIEIVQQKNKNIIVTGVGELIEPSFKKSHWFKKMKQDGKVYESTSMALETLGYTFHKTT